MTTHHYYSTTIEEDDGLRLRELGGDRPVHAEVLDQAVLEEYYASHRFSVGYRELQERWSRDWGSSCGLASPQHCPSSCKTSLRLRLREPSASAFPGNEGGDASSPGRCDRRREDSSTGSSPLETPTPSPCASAASSPGQRRSCQERASSPCCRGGVENAQNDGRRRGRFTRLLQTLQQALHGMRRRSHPPQVTKTMEDQLVVLEAELESYKQLSAAKKHAADLLKHQLMEALYEQVVGQLEQQQRQHQLQQQMMALEVQLHTQKAAARRGLRQLNTQLQRALSEKQLLQRRLSLLLLPNDVIAQDYEDMMHEGCDVVPCLDPYHKEMNLCRWNYQKTRRASH